MRTQRLKYISSYITYFLKRSFHFFRKYFIQRWVGCDRTSKLSAELINLDFIILWWFWEVFSFLFKFFLTFLKIKSSVKWKLMRSSADNTDTTSQPAYLSLCRREFYCTNSRKFWIFSHFFQKWFNFLELEKCIIYFVKSPISNLTFQNSKI